MRFLVDENLSPALCAFLHTLTTEAHHVHALDSDRGDLELLRHADDGGYVLVTADDLGAVLERNALSGPSVIEIRELLGLPVGYQGRTVVSRLDEVRDALLDGAVVNYTLHDVHVRPLPHS